MAPGDRFYLMEFGDRPALWGDVGSLIRINGLIVGGSNFSTMLLLPGLRDDFVKNLQNEEWTNLILEPTLQEWSDFIQYSDDPHVYVQEGMAKVFHRKMRYAISGAVQQQVWAADGFMCVYCGAKMGETMLTIDHFVPLEQGGANNTSNFVSACRKCNKRKGGMEPVEWMAGCHRWLGNPLERVEQVLKYLKERKV